MTTQCPLEEIARNDMDSMRAALAVEIKDKKSLKEAKQWLWALELRATASRKCKISDPGLIQIQIDAMRRYNKVFSPFFPMLARLRKRVVEAESRLQP